MHDNTGALHITVLHATTGRVRLQFEKSVVDPTPFKKIEGVFYARYNPRIRTLVCNYDPNVIRERQLLFQIGATYVSQQPTELLHVKHAEEATFTVPPSGLLALAAIAMDAAVTLSGSSLTAVTKWLSVGTTLGAVIEHGYQELHQRGSFDPEVMSVIYLFNSIGKTNMLQASAIAWIVTYGRHILPKDPRESCWTVHRHGASITLTPVAIRQGSSYMGSLLGRSAELLVRTH